jgi:CheY-like chemotaxis protein
MNVRPRRVLVVDDDADTVESLALLLRLRGHEVRVAREGSAALGEARHFGPEVVFLDLGLPGMSGLEVARRMRQEPGLEGVFLVAVSGYGREEDRQRAFDAGFDAHFLKPCDPAALEQLVVSRPAR